MNKSGNDVKRMALLSIVVDDFDSAKGKETQQTEAQHHQHESEVSIRKILDEAEYRKHEFWKLIDEHNAVVENLKRIERKDERNVCKVQTKQIRT